MASTTSYFFWLGFNKVHNEPKLAGWMQGTTSYWLHLAPKSRAKNKFSVLNPRVSHIAFRATFRQVVDKLYQECLKPNKVRVLYGGPGEQPYVKGYYAVYFLDPDGIKLEVMWVPKNPKHEHRV